MSRPRGSKNRKTLEKEKTERKERMKEAKIKVPEIIEEIAEKPQNRFDLKSKLTDRELRFIEIYLSQGCNQEKAMIQAGYTEYGKDYRLKLATKIVAKYEQQAGDHRKIMRAMGYGEVRVLQMIADSAENGKSEIVRLNAKLAMAKFLGLSQEAIQANQGITIVIQGQDQRVAIMGSQPGQAEIKEPPMPLSITK